MANTNTKLSPAQQRTLKSALLNVSNPGQSRVPTGFATAGRAASAWHRTSKVLARKGLIEWHGSNFWSVTSAGVAAAVAVMAFSERVQCVTRINNRIDDLFGARKNTRGADRVWRTHRIEAAQKVLDLVNAQA